MSVEESLLFFKNLHLSASERHIAAPILKNIVERLEFLSGV
jgi:excinuclease UvrABC ATPase subunit